MLVYCKRPWKDLRPTTLSSRSLQSGQRVEVLLNATTRRDASGKALGVVGVGQDITELKRGKAELQRVANDLRLLIDTANAPIFGIDADGKVNEWNRKMAAITGFKEEVHGDDLVEKYISDEFRSSVKEVLSNALLGVQTDNYQLPLFTKDGKRVELLLNAATRCDAAGAIVGVVGVGQDITAINQSQAELARGERLDASDRHGQRPDLWHRRQGTRQRMEPQGS